METLQNKIRGVLILGNVHSHPSTGTFLKKILGLLEIIATRVIVLSGYRLHSNSFNVQHIPIKHSTKIPTIKLVLLSQISTIPAIVKVIENVDVVVVFGPLPFPVFFIKLFYKNKKIVLYRGGAPHITQQNFLKKKLIWYLIEYPLILLSDIIIVESYSSIKFQKMDKFKDKILVIPQYVEDIFINKTLKKDKVLSYYGSFSKHKGVHLLVDALTMLAPLLNILNFKVVFGGAGPLKNYIKNRLHRRLNEIVILDWVPHEKLPYHLNQTEFIILPSFGEGIPNIILEAMGSCVVPVVSKSGGLSDLVVDGQNGFIIHELSEKGIYDVLLNILLYSSPKELKKIGHKAHLLILSRFTVKNALSRYKFLLKILIPRGK